MKLLPKMIAATTLASLAVAGTFSTAMAGSTHGWNSRVMTPAMAQAVHTIMVEELKAQKKRSRRY